jgi:hypothetical protein
VEYTVADRSSTKNERYKVLKGYPTINKKAQRRFLLSIHRSATYKNAYWIPEYKGSRKYILSGDEVERDLKFIYRIVWNVSYRDIRGKVKKQQKHISNIQYWNVIDDFKEFLRLRQGIIEGIKNDHFDGHKQTFLPGKLSDVEAAIDEFVLDLGSDISIQGRIDDALMSKLCADGKPDDSSEFASAISKFNHKWHPIKREIAMEFTRSNEFKIWLSNEAMRRAGPREPTEEEIRAQRKSDEETEKFKKAFGQTFGQGSQRSGQTHSEFKSDELGSCEGVYVKNREIALKIVQAGFRVLAKKHHSDTGGDDDMMRVILETKNELIGSL